MRYLMTACLIAGLVLMLFIGGAAGQFGMRVTNSSPEVGLIVEDFVTVPPMTQTPVLIGWWDIGPNWAVFDEGDVLYLSIGGIGTWTPNTPSVPIKVNDIRLTNSPFGPAGSKVGAADPDMGQLLTGFASPLPQIVFVDEGSTINQFDINDSVYIKTVFPLGIIRIGDIRLSPSSTLPGPGTMVLGLDPDYDAACLVLNGGPNFGIWPPGQSGMIRFYNANGNLNTALFANSQPIYDEPDVVYFDVSSPTVANRLFGHITPNAIRLSN